MTHSPSNLDLYVNASVKLGLTVEKIDSGIRSPLMISNGAKFTLINTKSPGFYPSNMRWTASFTGSKMLSQKILSKIGYKTIKTHFIKKTDFESSSQLREFITAGFFTFPVLVKPNYGSDGENISIVENLEDLVEVACMQFENKRSFLIQPIMSESEYRVLVVNGTVQLIHSKANQYVTGDGVATIAALLESVKPKNKDSVYIKWQYKKMKLDSASILPNGIKFEHHLTKVPSLDYYKTSDFDPAMEKWALKLAADISSSVVGIDVFVPGSVSDTDAYTIIELNSNPAVYYLPKRCNDIHTGPRIVEKVLRDYFNIPNK
jgi:hypothetical protein